MMLGTIRLQMVAFSAYSRRRRIKSHVSDSSFQGSLGIVSPLA